MKKFFGDLQQIQTKTANAVTSAVSKFDKTLAQDAGPHQAEEPKFVRSVHSQQLAADSS